MRTEAGPPWVRYRLLLDLEGVPQDAPKARDALADLLAAPCPFAALIMLELLAALREEAPEDPGLWYDILHAADVLSRFPKARKDPRFRDLIAVLLSKARPDGTFVPESVYLPYKAWDFGQKKEPSEWIKFAVERIQFRLQIKE